MTTKPFNGSYLAICKQANLVGMGKTRKEAKANLIEAMKSL